MKIEYLGKGVWADNYYILHTCPLCGDLWSFRTLGQSGYWECWSCSKNGLKLDDVFDLGEEGIEAPEGLIVLSEYKAPPEGDSYPTGFNSLDTMLGGLEEGFLTVISGKRGEGKSSLCSQIALNSVNYGNPICFYSGEMKTKTFREWLYQQAAGNDWVMPYKDRYGATRYKAKPVAEEKITKWLSNRIIMYDNTVTKSSERSAIIERFTDARRTYGCKLFFIDNLMTAKYTDADKDFYRQQSNFVGELTEFCLQSGVHVVLVAHPKKVGEKTDLDENDQIAGSGDIPNRASNVIRVEKTTDKEKEKLRASGETVYDSVVKVTKNRAYGTTGDIPFRFDSNCRRFVDLVGTQINRYSWEDL